MTCGVKFCGGCNPRYDRGEVYKSIKEYFGDRVQFVIAEEGHTYDCLLIIGGCTNCCASFKQYNWRTQYIKMWEKEHFNSVVDKIEELISSSSPL